MVTFFVYLKRCVVFLFINCIVLAQANILLAQTNWDDGSSMDDIIGFTPTTPIAVVDHPKQVFQPVIEGQIVYQGFDIQNTGSFPLIIQKIQTDCSCTTADYPKEIAPDDTGTIMIKLDTEGYGGQTVTQEILISTNDPINKEVHLTLTGKVDLFVLMNPKKINLTGSVASHVEETVMIQPLKGDFTIKSISLNRLKDKISVTYQKSAANYILKATNIYKKSGRYWGRMTIIVDHPLIQSFSITVQGNIQ